MSLLETFESPPQARVPLIDVGVNFRCNFYAMTR